MSAAKLRALRALVRIRVNRQASFDKACSDAQIKLKQLTVSVEEAGEAVLGAEENTAAQQVKIERLTTSGTRFQIGHYLGEQDYLATLQQEEAKLSEEKEQATAAMQAQAEVLKQARHAAAKNVRRRERLEEQLTETLQSIDCAELDRQDEEAEEAITARLRRQREKTHADAAEGDYV